MPPFGSKIFHVEFSDPVDTPDGSGCHFYFGSLAAIYDTFPADRIGVALTSIYSHYRGDSSAGSAVVYSNDRVTIREGVIIRKKSKSQNDG